MVSANHASNNWPQITLEFGSVGFCGGKKTGEPREDPRRKVRTNNKLNPHETVSTGIEPESQRGEASDIICTTSAPPRNNDGERRIMLTPITNEDP